MSPVQLAADVGVYCKYHARSYSVFFHAHTPVYGMYDVAIVTRQTVIVQNVGQVNTVYLSVMKTIFLNVWHANCKPELTPFISEHQPTTDIFCFMEADLETRAYLHTLLPDYTVHTAQKTANERGTIDLAIYVRGPLKVLSVRTLLQNEPGTGLAFVAYVQHDAQTYAVTAVHGISFAGDTKLDTPGRIVQSQTIIDALKGVDGPVIIGGDFNMLPGTKSMSLFAEAGYADLIADYDIKTTRNRLIWERYPETIQYYADFAFTSPNLTVRRFAVSNNEVSDHLPLIVETTIASRDLVLKRLSSHDQQPSERSHLTAQSSK